MNQKFQRKEKVLGEIGKRIGLSPNDVAWLTKALDPFHDVPVQHLTGYPDGSNSKTVVQDVKTSFTIERSNNLTSSSTWGFMLRMDDNLAANNCPVAVVHKNIIEQSPSGSNPYLRYGGVTVTEFTSSTPNPLYLGSDGSGQTQVQYEYVTTDSTYARGRGRVIARAFEIYNTTAEINKQGTLTCYEQPTVIDSVKAFTHLWAQASPEDDDEDNKNKEKEKEKEKDKNKRKTKSQIDVQHNVGIRSARMTTVPPGTLAEAKLLPGTTQWKAADGCMMVQTMSQMENPHTYMEPVGVICLVDESALNYNNDPLEPLQCYTEAPTSIEEFKHTGEVASDGSEVNTFYQAYALNKKIPFCSMGAIATGLSSESTFTVNIIETIERAVSFNEKDIVVLGSVSPPKNPIALELYSTISRMLPVAVPVSENGLGDWFIGIVDSIVSTVSSIGKPLMGAVQGWTDTRNAENRLTTVPFKEPVMTGRSLSNKNKTKQVREPTRKPGTNSVQPKKGGQIDAYQQGIKNEQKQIRREQQNLDARTKKLNREVSFNI